VVLALQDKALAVHMVAVHRSPLLLVIRVLHLDILLPAAVKAAMRWQVAVGAVGVEDLLHRLED
jgi:hypothetical protein